MYKAVHGDPRRTEEVTLLSGDLFPRCRECIDELTFVLIRVAPFGVSAGAFRIHVFEIPHPQRECGSDALRSA
jgi:hypothetical protein